MSPQSTNIYCLERDTYTILRERYLAGAFSFSAAWVGWNAQFTEDPLLHQRIEYMENITLHFTRLDVIAETLPIPQRVAPECGDGYAVVHHDLLMAKSAIQIQATESPRYVDIFICFGPFHTEMAYFAALGHILDGSGGLEILTEVGVLVPKWQAL